MRLALAQLVFVVISAVASASASLAAPNATAFDLFTLVNPNTALGFADDAIAVAMPDSQTIMDRLSDAQEEAIAAKTLADIDRVYSKIEIPGVASDAEREAESTASEMVEAGPDKTESTA